MRVNAVPVVEKQYLHDQQQTCPCVETDRDNIKYAIATAVVLVMDEMRKVGFDAREYSIFVTFDF